MHKKVMPTLMPHDAYSLAPKNRRGIFKLLGWVWKYSKSNALFLGIAMLCATGISSLSAITLLFAKKVVDVSSQYQEPAALFYPIGTVVGLLLSSILLKLFGTTFEALAVTNMRSKFEISCLEHLSTLNYEYLAGPSANKLTGVIMGEIPVACTIMGVVIRSFVRAPITILFLVLILLLQVNDLMLALLVVSPLLLLGIRFFTEHVKAAANSAFATMSQMYAKLNEQLTGIRTVVSLGLGGWFSNKLTHYAKVIAEASRKAALFQALQRSIQEVVSILFLIGLLCWIAWLVSHERIMLSQAFIIPATAWLCRGEILKLSEGYVQLQKSAGAVARLLDFLDASPVKDGSVELKEPITSVRLDNVSFRYPDSEVVLEQINLELKPGLTVITGESGSGKSTLCDICLRIRKPTSGTVYFNHIPLGDLKEKSIRTSTALVEQEPFLFEDTIRFNLNGGRQSFSDDRLYTVLKSVSAESFVNEFPLRLDAALTQNASNLSVGQKQRIAVARAISREPHFLILDEFTSSLDEKTERQVLKTIERLSERMIILCATHRSNVIQQADTVYRIVDKTLVRIDLPEAMQAAYET